MAMPSAILKELLVAAQVGTFGLQTQVLLDDDTEDLLDDSADQLLADMNSAANWSILISKLPDRPNNCIALFDGGGLAPDPKWLLDFPDVNILIRAARYEAAYFKAKQVQDALLGVDSQDLLGDRLVSVTQIGNTSFVGRDDKDRPTFSITLRLIIEPGASALTNREPL